MKNTKSSESKVSSYAALGEFWDAQNLNDHWSRTRPAKFDVQIESESSYFGVEKDLAERLSGIAKRRGIPSTTLVNLWLQEKLNEAKAT